jgi:hypothetical protein
MRFYGEMRVQGSGPLDGARFDALAYALAEIEDTDPAVTEVDLTASLAQGWVTASMVIDRDDLEQAVAKLIATVRTAIYPNGDIAGSWKFLAETADLSIRPADRAPAPGRSPAPDRSPAADRAPIADPGTAPGRAPATDGPGRPGPPPPSRSPADDYLPAAGRLPASGPVTAVGGS